MRKIISNCQEVDDKYNFLVSYEVLNLRNTSNLLSNRRNTFPETCFNVFTLSSQFISSYLYNLNKSENIIFHMTKIFYYVHKVLRKYSFCEYERKLSIKPWCEVESPCSLLEYPKINFLLYFSF